MATVPSAMLGKLQAFEKIDINYDDALFQQAQPFFDALSLYPVFLVGGAPRDVLLGLAYHDLDVVTGATIEQILAVLEPFADDIDVFVNRGSPVVCITVRSTGYVLEIASLNMLSVVDAQGRLRFEPRHDVCPIDSHCQPQASPKLGNFALGAESKSGIYSVASLFERCSFGFESAVCFKKISGSKSHVFLWRFATIN